MNKSLEQIGNHLGFLGYEVKPIEDNGGRPFFFANHPTDYNISVIEFAPKQFLFKTNIIHDNAPGTDMDVALNATNRILNVSRVYYDIVDGKVMLRVEATYIGEYNKEALGAFLFQFLRDIRNIPQVEEFRRAFIDERGNDDTVLGIRTPLRVIESRVE